MPSLASPAPGSHHLPFFVYGTLLPGQPNFALWGDAVEKLQPATLARARLYDMGHYPMLVEEPATVATGALVTVRPDSFDEVVMRLDFLEGYDPADPDAGEYRRVRRVARLGNGLPQVAWVYAGRCTQVVGRSALDQSWSAHCYQQELALEAWWANVRSVARRSGGEGPVKDRLTSCRTA